MNLKFCHLFITIGVILVLSGCKRVPDYVIPPDRMAEVMADMHIAETFVENNYRDYQTDSSKMLLKQSVLARHGYTLENLDTSFMWYGANLTVYHDVYDKTVQILQNRLSESGAIAVMNLSSIDSTDIWDDTRFMIVKPHSPSQILTFSFNNDSTWQQGDRFTLRAKFANGLTPMNWNLSTEYDDETIEVLSGRQSGDGWREMTLITDSTRTPMVVAGSIAFDVARGALIVDSIQLIRKPVDDKAFTQRYKQRKYDFSSKRSHKEDEPPEEVVE